MASERAPTTNPPPNPLSPTTRLTPSAPNLPSQTAPTTPPPHPSPNDGIDFPAIEKRIYERFGSDVMEHQEDLFSVKMEKLAAEIAAAQLELDQQLLKNRHAYFVANYGDRCRIPPMRDLATEGYTPGMREMFDRMADEIRAVWGVFDGVMDGVMEEEGEGERGGRGREGGGGKGGTEVIVPGSRGESEG